MNDELKLLVEWSSPWQEFLTAIRPALGRSPEPLDGEAPIGLFPYRGMLASWIIEGAVLALAHNAVPNHRQIGSVRTTGLAEVRRYLLFRRGIATNRRCGRRPSRPIRPRRRP